MSVVIIPASKGFLIPGTSHPIETAVGCLNSRGQEGLCRHAVIRPPSCVQAEKDCLVLRECRVPSFSQAAVMLTSDVWCLLFFGNFRRFSSGIVSIFQNLNVFF